MNVARRMADGLDLGGAAGGVDIVCIYDEEPSAFLDSFATNVRTGIRLLLLEPDANQLSADDGVPAATVPYSAQRFYVWPKTGLAVGHDADVIGGCNATARRRTSQ